MVIYMIGIQQDRKYIVDTNKPCKRYLGNDDNLNGLNKFNANINNNDDRKINHDISQQNHNINQIPPSCPPAIGDDDVKVNSNNNNNAASSNNNNNITTTIPFTINTNTEVYIYCIIIYLCTVFIYRLFV